MFFTALSVYCLVVFRNYQLLAPLSPDWFLWLGFTGVSLGLVVSVKWVGLFTIALVGVHTIDELWAMWGDLKVSMVPLCLNTENLYLALDCPHHFFDNGSYHYIRYYFYISFFNS
jgi:hypothetical protein